VIPLCLGFTEFTEVSARLLGSDYAQAMVNQEKLIKLLQEINSDDELINTQSVIEENLNKIQEQRAREAQSHQIVIPLCLGFRFHL
jgi:hypothetical protein